MLIIVKLSKNSTDSYTFVTEAGHGAAVCPRGMYCLHLTKFSKDSLTMEEIFQTVMKSEPQILWTLDYKVKTETFCSNLSKNLFLTCGPHFELDYDVTIERAKKIFEEMFPEEPFLPRAPDPEEIILDDPSPPQETDE